MGGSLNSTELLNTVTPLVVEFIIVLLLLDISIEKIFELSSSFVIFNLCKFIVLLLVLPSTIKSPFIVTLPVSSPIPEGSIIILL